MLSPQAPITNVSVELVETAQQSVDEVLARENLIHRDELVGTVGVADVSRSAYHAGNPAVTLVQTPLGAKGHRRRCSRAGGATYVAWMRLVSRRKSRAPGAGNIASENTEPRRLLQPNL